MPQPTVPLWRLVLAWFVLVAGVLVACWLLGPHFDPDNRLAALALTWVLTGKVASLLCMAPANLRRLHWRSFVAYLVCPEMRPNRFLPERVPSPEDIAPTPSGVLLNILAATVFLWGIPALLPAGAPFLLRVWSGTIGAAFVVLFVRFDIAVLLFRWMGFAVEKAWYCPIASTTLAEFWGLRWNRISSGLFRDVLFMPMARRMGAGLALFAVFFYSGLMHETFSVAAGSGYGGPVLYFLLQGAAIWFEGRRGFRKALLKRPWLGRAWTALVVLAPVGLVLHPGFMDHVMLPMLAQMKVPGIAP